MVYDIYKEKRSTRHLDHETQARAQLEIEDKWVGYFAPFARLMLGYCHTSCLLNYKWFKYSLAIRSMQNYKTYTINRF